MIRNQTSTGGVISSEEYYPIYDETSTKVNPELEAQLAELAKNGVDGRVQIIINGAGHSINSEEQLQQYVARLKEQCGWSDNVLDIAIVTKPPRFLNLFRQGNAEQVVSRAIGVAEQEQLEVDLRDTDTPYQDDIAAYIARIANTQEVSTVHKEAPIRDRTTSTEQPKTPNNPLPVGDFLVGGSLITVAAITARLVQGRRVRRATKDTKDAFSTAQQAWIEQDDLITQQLGVFDPEDAVDNRQAITDKTDSIMAKLAAVVDAFDNLSVGQRRRLWPQLKDPTLVKYIQDLTHEMTTTTEFLVLQNNELSDRVGSIEETVQQYESDYNKVMSVVGTLKETGWNVDALQNSLEEWTDELEVVLAQRAKNFIDKPVDTITASKKAHQGLMSRVESLIKERENIDSEIRDAQAIVRVHETVLRRAMLADEKLRADFSAECLKGVSEHIRVIDGDIAIYKETVLDLCATVGNKSVGVLDQSRVKLSELAQKNTHIRGLVAGLEKRLKQLQEIRESVPRQIDDIVSVYQSTKSFIQTAESDIEQNTVDAVAGLLPVIEAIQNTIQGVEKPNYLGIDASIKKLKAELELLNEQSKVVKAKMSTAVAAGSNDSDSWSTPSSSDNDSSNSGTNDSSSW